MATNPNSPLCEYCDLDPMGSAQVIPPPETDTYTGFFEPIWLMVKSAISSISDIAGDLFLQFLCGMLEVVLYVADLIQLPEITVTLQMAVSNLSPDIAWLLNQVGFYDDLLIIGSGYAFYMLRKLLTLGKW